MRMESETGERLSVIVEEVKEYEWFQKLAEVGRRHQARDRPVSLPAGGHWSSSARAERVKLRWLGGRRAQDWRCSCAV
jgi:hypothetical protein